MEIVIALVAGLVGGLAGAWMGGRVVGAAQSRQAWRLAADAEAKRMLNLFQALLAELTQVWQAYTAVLGEGLEKAEEPDDLPFAGIFRTSQHYFSVYDQAGHTLGTLDPDSCRQVVETYVQLKGFFDELNQFHHLASKQREVRLQANVNVFEAKAVREEVDALFAYLKKRHLQVKGLVLGSLEGLQEFINLGKQARSSVQVKIQVFE